MNILKFFKNFFKYILLGLKSIPSILKSIFIHFFKSFTLLNKKKTKEKTTSSVKQPQKKSKKTANQKSTQPVKKVPKTKTKKIKIKKSKKGSTDEPREPMEIDYEGPDSVKSKTKQTYQYLIKTPEGKEVIGYFDAYSKVEVHSFLLSEGNIIYDIQTSKSIQLLHGSAFGMSTKIKNKDLIFLLAQLSTYLKAGIALVDSVKILVKQFKNPQYQRILRAVVYDLSTGKSFSEALDKQGEAFPRLLINMIKASEMTGELPETLDDMEEYFSEIEVTRKAMVSAMMYPVIIFVIAIGVGLFIMLYVVPKFVEIYESMDDTEIPGITKFVLGLSDFLSNYVIYLGIAAIVLLLVFSFLYKKIKVFRGNVQWAIMHLPIFGNVVIYNEVTMFTKTFASLLAHNVFITDSMEILNKVTNNEVFKTMIGEAMLNISKGGNISEAFKDQWAFPIPAYEMIVTGEKTGQLPEMMSKVSKYYQNLHRNAVTRIKTFIEPVLIILLTVMVGVIVLSIVIPMFNMYGAIQQ